MTNSAALSARLRAGRPRLLQRAGDGIGDLHAEHVAEHRARTAAASPDRNARPGAAGDARGRHRRPRAGARPAARRRDGTSAIARPGRRACRARRGRARVARRPGRPRRRSPSTRDLQRERRRFDRNATRRPSSARRASRVSGSSASARLSAASSVRPASGFQLKRRCGHRGILAGACRASLDGRPIPARRDAQGRARAGIRRTRCSRAGLRSIDTCGT